MSLIEDAARLLVAAHAEKNSALADMEDKSRTQAFIEALDAWDDACSKASAALLELIQAVHDADTTPERTVKRPATLADGLLNLDDNGGH